VDIGDLIEVGLEKLKEKIEKDFQIVRMIHLKNERSELIFRTCSVSGVYASHSNRGSRQASHLLA